MTFFGYVLIKKSELEKHELRHIKLSEVYRWFSGWKDLDIIWEYIFKNKKDISNCRAEYAEARGTDVYGQNKKH